MNGPTRARWSTVVLVASLVAGCRGAPAETGEALTSAPASSVSEPPWTSATTDGTRVTVSFNPPTPRIGRMTMHVVVGDGSSEEAVSVDLVSPTMPAHGVVRSALVSNTAEISIPMEGRWAIYVNLDEVGARAVEFVFDVASEGS